MTKYMVVYRHEGVIHWVVVGGLSEKDCASWVRCNAAFEAEMLLAVPVWEVVKRT